MYIYTPTLILLFSHTLNIRTLSQREREKERERERERDLGIRDAMKRECRSSEARFKASKSGRYASKTVAMV